MFQECLISKSEESSFFDCVLSNWDQMKPPLENQEKDYGVKLYHLLRYSKNRVTGFLSSFVVTSPHSTAVERCISSAHNVSFSNLRTSTSEETINNRLQIYWNGPSCDMFNAEPIINIFFTDKERRNNFPIVSAYEGRTFMCNFFFLCSVKITFS